jgi:hypothetical protein
MTTQHALLDKRIFGCTVLRFACINVLGLICVSLAHAEGSGEFFGLLRGRDLTPFGSLRLDMRPAHAIAIEQGSYVIAAELGYQNTWALSPEVERYLTDQEPNGRHELGPADAQAIRDLPGENYLLDLESAVFDLQFHYKFAQNMSLYVIATGILYGGGFLDSTIESFHDTFGFSTFGRPAVSRNDANLIYDLKSASVELFDTPTSGGFTDPTIGVRYTGIDLSEHWRLGFEGAIKIPVGGHRQWLSTGRTDYGVQLSLQRRANRHAFYTDVAAVYYAGAQDPAPQEEQVIPTLLLGYEYQWLQHTNVIVQGYVSKSAYTSKTTDLEELNGTKYQITLGLRHMQGKLLYTFGFTENLQNVNNTPDISVQFGLAYIPRLIRQAH